MQQDLRTSSKRQEKYCIKYQDNNSKRWDGREIWVNAEFIEDHYDPQDLVPGFKVSFPWKSKNKITNWNAVIVDPKASV